MYSLMQDLIKKSVFSLAVIFIAVGLSVFSTSQAYAAETVGNESYTACWDATAGLSSPAFYFGQTDTGKKDTAVKLDQNSRCLTVSSLKPCTSYSYNISGEKNGKWNWEWASDKTFTTEGTCESSSPATSGSTPVSSNTAVVGNASADAMWTTVDGASAYHVYYRESSSTTFGHAVKVPTQSRSVTVKALNPAVTYYYKVAGIVGGKEVFQAEKVLRSGSQANIPPVLGVNRSTPKQVKKPVVKQPAPTKKEIKGTQSTKELKKAVKKSSSSKKVVTPQKAKTSTGKKKLK